MKIGIDMGGMSIKFGLVNTDNQIVAKTTILTCLDISYEKLIKSMADAVMELLSSQKLTIEDCEGIGIGSPGTIDDINGVIQYSNNFNWENIPIVSKLRKYLNTEIRIANDADAAALGEVCAGVAKEAENAVLLTLGTGIGCGVIIHKKIFHGPLVGGCELGHSVIRQGGQLCTCGRRGCLEAYASATALIRIAKEKALENPQSVMNKMCYDNLENMNGRIPFDTAAMGDEAGKAVVEEYEDYLACGVTNIINIFRPAIIILGGGVAAQRENLTKPLQKKVNDMCFGGKHGQIAKIVTSELGNDAGIIGAANLI